MKAPKTPKPMSFWKLYILVMAVDLILYVLVFYAGEVIPLDPPASGPGEFGLGWWLLAHFPAVLILSTGVLPDSLTWLLILQDAWVVGLIYWWSLRVRRSKLIHASKSVAPTGQE